MDLVPQLRGGRRGDSRGDRPVGVDGVPRVHSGQRDETPRTPGAGPLGEDVVALVLDGKTFAETTMVVALGITMTGDKRFLGFVETEHRERAGVDPVPPVLGRAGPRCFPGASGDRRWRQGLRAAVRHAFRHRALVQRCQWHKRENVVSYLAKREQPVWRQRLQRAYTVRSTTRPSPPSSRSSMSWRIGTNRRPAVWRKAWTRPDVASSRRVWRAGPVAEDDERPRVHQRAH